MRARHRSAPLLVAALLLSVACRGCSVVENVQSRLRGDASLAIITQQEPSSAPVATAVPTATPAVRIDSLSQFPREAGTTFELLVTEEELNERLSGEVVERQGVTASAAHVTLAEGAILGSVSATHGATGVTVQLTFRGQPRLVDGQVLFAIEDVTLDDSVRGMARLVVQGIIDQALAQTNADEGIALPVEWPENIEILAVRVEPGAFVLTGRTQ